MEYLRLFSWNIIVRMTHYLIHRAINSTVTQLKGNISFTISSHLFTHVKYICFWTGLGIFQKRLAKFSGSITHSKPFSFRLIFLHFSYHVAHSAQCMDVEAIKGYCNNSASVSSYRGPVIASLWHQYQVWRQQVFGLAPAIRSYDGFFFSLFGTGNKKHSPFLAESHRISPNGFWIITS